MYTGVVWVLAYRPESCHRGEVRLDCGHARLCHFTTSCQGVRAAWCGHAPDWVFLQARAPQEQGIATAQLPLGEYVEMGSCSRVLAVNHVLQIVVEHQVAAGTPLLSLAASGLGFFKSYPLEHRRRSEDRPLHHPSCCLLIGVVGVAIVFVVVDVIVSVLVVGIAA